MRIFLTSDWHKAPFKAQKFKTQKKNWIERLISWRMSKQEKERAIFEAMTKVIREESIKLVINNGDLMENPQNERGLITRKGIATAKQIMCSFCEKHHVQMELNAGNHEGGYDLGLATDQERGISRASVSGFLELTGRKSMYHSFELDGYRIILIPFLLGQEYAKDFNLEELKRNILMSLERDLRISQRVILFTHDPEAFSHKGFYRLITCYRSKIEKIFTGHWHAQWNYWPNWLLAKIFNHWWLYPFDLFIRFALLILSRSFHIQRAVKRDYRRYKEVPRRVKELKAAIIPAPLGILGFGGGFLTLDLETLEVKKY